jgi:eukaryotic-like serine/threonine-protein kinase
LSATDPPEVAVPMGPPGAAGRLDQPPVEEATAPGATGAPFSLPPEARYCWGVAKIGLQVAGALAYAHKRGIHHRDIKLSNLLLDEQGTVWVADFGLAKLEDSEDLTETGGVVGTLRFLPPERFEGWSDQRSDVYGLGVTLYELLTLRPAFPGRTRTEIIQQVLHRTLKPPRRHDRRIPQDLESIVLKAMAREPAQRYGSADAMAEDLGRFLEGRPLRWARRAGSLERAWRWSRRNPVVAGLLTAVAAILILSAAGATHSNWRLFALLRQLEQAQGETREQLRGSLLAQAQALRGNDGQPGRRAQALEALTRAARIRLGPDVRDEAIASLAWVDLGPVRTWDVHRPAGMDLALTVDPPLERYTTVDGEGNTLVRTVADDRVLAIFLGPFPRTRRSWHEFSPDGRYLAVLSREATLQRDQRIAVWDLARDVPALRLEAGRGIAFFPDSRSVATVLPEGAIGVFDLPGGHEVRRIGRDFTARLCPGGLDPDGRRLVLCGPSDRRALVLLELATGAILETIEVPAKPVAEAIAWSGDGRRLAVGAEDGTVRIWDLDRHGWAATLKGHLSEPERVAFSPDGWLLASGGWDYHTHIWEVAGGRELVRVPGMFRRFRRDGRQLVCQNGDRLGLWELGGDRECRVLPDAATRVDFSPDGRLLASLGRDAVVLWEVATGREVARLTAETAFDDGNGTVEFQPRGESLVSFGRGGLFRHPIRAILGGGPGAWQVGPPEALAGPTPGRWQWACWSGDGRRLAFADHPRGRVVVLGSDRPSERIVREDLPGVVTVALSPDGRWAAAGFEQGAAVRAWEVDAAEVPRLLPAETSSTTHHVAFSPDGAWLVVGGPSEYRFWEVGSWRVGPILRRQEVDEHAGTLAFSQDGRWLAVAISPRDVGLIDPATGRLRARLPAPDSGLISGLAFRPDGRLLAVAAGAYGLQIWDLHLIRQGLAPMGLDRDVWPDQP